MDRLWRFWFWLSNNNERLYRLRCIFGGHVSQLAMDQDEKVPGQHLARATGRFECASCYRDMGPVDPEFFVKFPHFLEWH